MSADEPDLVRLARLRIVAARYPQMQGLRLALLGGCFAVSSVAALLLDLRSPAWIALPIVISMPGLLVLDRYYQTTFGRVRASRSDHWLLVIALASFAGVFLERGAGVPPLALWFGLLSAVELWWSIRDWPFRSHRAVSALACAAASALALLDGSAEALWWGTLLVGCAAVPVGMLDHRLLTEVLGTGAGRRVNVPSE